MGSKFTGVFFPTLIRLLWLRKGWGLPSPELSSAFWVHFEAIAVVSFANKSLLSCTQVSHLTSFDLHFDVYFHTNEQQQRSKTTESAQCWNHFGSQKVLKFWKAINHKLWGRPSWTVSLGCCWQSPLPPSAELGGEAGGAGAQAAVGNEKSLRMGHKF